MLVIVPYLRRAVYVVINRQFLNYFVLCVIF